MMERSWNAIEEDLLAFYQGEREKIVEDDRQFLDRLNFVENGDLSEIGEVYLDSKYIYSNEDHQIILREEVLNLPEIRSLCQSFYGQETTRDHVERFFKSKTDVHQSVKVGRTLNLLNHLDILSYSKRTGKIQFKETEEVDEPDLSSYRITHRTPYSNVLRLRKAIRVCEGDLMWVAKHFPKKGLEPLSEEVTGDSFETLRILCGPANVTSKMRSDFKRFEEEMGNRGIEAELRVLLDKSRLREWHDRWVISDTISWNVPPINSLYQNQEAEIHKTEDDIDFESWWSEAADIITEWDEIQPQLG